MSDFYLIVKNLTRKPLRLFLTCFAIFIAFLIFGAVATLKSALDAGIELSADNRLVVINKINFTQPLPISYARKVAAVEGVKNVTYANWFGGYYREPSNQVISMAVEAESWLRVYDREIVLTPEERAAWLGNRQGLIVGESLARRLGWKLGDLVPVSSNIFSQKEGGQTWDFVVEGIYTGSDPQHDTNSMYFHYKYFMETQSFGGDWVGWIILTTTDPALNQRIADDIDDRFANSPAETATSTEQAFNKAFIQQIGNIGLIIFGVVFMAFFTILILAGNTMALAVRERTGEIALLKTLGFAAPRIFRMVLAESLLIALIGGLVGLGGAWLVIEAARSVMAQFLPSLVMGADVILQALAFMLLLGLVTGLLPAFNALRLNIVTAFGRG